MIRYPGRALKAFAYLFRPYNDIDVFVEDTANRNMYEVLITDMLPGTARVQRVIQLGGKRQVVRACENDQADGGRPRLYVIDGDLELLLAIAAPRLKRLYRLSVYTSENLVFSEIAVVEVAYECLPNTSRAEVAKAVDFNGFVGSVVGPLGSLFACYAVVFKMRGDVATVGYGVRRLCRSPGSPVVLSSDKVEARIEELKKLLGAESDLDEVERSIGEVEARMGAQASERAKMISGKYLLTLLLHHLQRTACYSGTVEQLKVRLARHMQRDVDDGLLQTVRDASRAIQRRD